MRRGSISVEFAVTLPIVLLLLIGVLEWGRMLAREVAVVTVARDAAHAGALTKKTDDPTRIAKLQTEDGLRAAGFDPDLATVEVRSFPNPAGTMLELRVTVPFSALFGLIPVSSQLHAVTTIRMEQG
ncbi:MAG TPA: TadE/TadG family type IV pilus assembly protein [Myxococcota bacterium]|nr:TadE/TadG family type IV pilus assembly protein [Myxococcota bacterium]